MFKYGVLFMTFLGEFSVANKRKGYMQFRCHHCKATVEQEFS